MFSSALPMNSLKILGPFTILGFTEFKTPASFFAINVLPQPGGPYNKTPFACLIPYFCKTAGGNLLEANAFLKISANS